MSIKEITYDTSGPSCHVCGALMAHTRVMGTWECLSCDATTCIVPVQEKDSAKDPNDGLSGSSPRLGHCGSCVQRHTYDGPCPCNCHVLERLQEKEGKVGEKKTPLDNCEQEDREFNDKWHLVSANRKTWRGTVYARSGESIVTCNAGAWYAYACYWREEFEKQEAAHALVHREEAPGTCNTADWPHLHSDGSGHKRLHVKRDSCTNWGDAAELLNTSALLLSDYSGELAKQKNTAKLEQVRNVIAELDVMTREMRKGQP